MLNTIVLNLLEAQVTLYATNADGSLGAALWSGQAAEHLSVKERWLTVETRPTGAAYPVQHPLIPQYDIAIDRVWALPLSNLTGFQPTSQNYILEVIWTEEESQQWHRRMFYGVTIVERSFAPQNIESEFVDGQEFAAQSFLADSGASGVSPPTVVAVPLVVYWSGADGYFPLYNYDSVNGFVLADGATVAGHATIATDASSGALSIQFDGTSAPVLVTSATGVTVGELHDTIPTALPSLLFYYGTALLAAVSPAGFWARVIADTPSGGALPGGVGFTLEFQAQAVAMVQPGQVTALAWTAQN